MNNQPPTDNCDLSSFFPTDPEPIVAELVPEPAAPRPPQRRPPSSFWKFLPVLLFVATCMSTFFVGWFGSGSVFHGFVYSACLMTILVCHEMGHYLQARRYRVPASLPFFIPVPIPPIGTMGAVIGMRPGVGDRKAIFDIGITGPLAGLVPTLIFCVVGLHQSELGSIANAREQFGEPLLMQFLAWLHFGPRPEGHDVMLNMLNPMLFAAWVGLLITSLNLIPIGQLDGGHVLYALLRRKAHHVASWLLSAAAIAVVIAAVFFHYPVWILMILLLLVMGPEHPPTANDDVPLGSFRVVLGWLTLAFVLVGFTPMPFKM